MSLQPLSPWAILDPSLAFAEISAQVGANQMTGATISLTSAQILNSHTTPIQFVDGVPGKTIVITSVFFDYAHTSANYTNAQVVALYYGNLYEENASVDVSPPTTPAICGCDYYFLTQTMTRQMPVGSAMIAGESLSSLQGLPITIRSAPTNPVNGDGSLKITITYCLV